VPKNPKEDLEVVTLRLYQGDKDRLDEYYPQLGYNKIVRLIVRNHLQRLDKKVERALSPSKINPIDLGELDGNDEPTDPTL
jgi:hypothetical protein